MMTSIWLCSSCLSAEPLKDNGAKEKREDWLQVGQDDVEMNTYFAR